MMTIISHAMTKTMKIHTLHERDKCWGVCLCGSSPFSLFQSLYLYCSVRVFLCKKA